MRKKILPITMPITDCYPSTSSASAILFSDNNIKDWMYNNFIQLFEVEDNHALDYYDFSIDNNIFLSYNELEYSFIHNNWDSLTDFFIRALEDDYYIRVFVNRAKLPLYDEQWSQQHDLLIYGFDKHHKLFYVADHFSNGKFSFETCDFYSLEKAVDSFKPRLFKKNPGFLNCVQLIRKETSLHKLRYSMYTPEEMQRITSFDLSRVIDSFEDYLSCKPTKNWYTRGHVMDNSLASSHTWGIDCYDTLDLFCQNWSNEFFDSSFACQSFYVMINHKKVMIERLNVIKKHFKSFSHKKHQENFSKLAEKLNLLMLKYVRMTMYQKDDYANLHNSISELKHLDFSYMEILKKDLQLL